MKGSVLCFPHREIKTVKKMALARGECFSNSLESKQIHIFKKKEKSIMVKKLFFCVFAFLFVVGCATTKHEPAPVAEINANATAVAVSGSGETASVTYGSSGGATGGTAGAGTIAVCESTSCGERHVVGSNNWQSRYEDVGYYYEVIDKGCDGFKVKPMALIRIDGTLWAIHLPGCCRGLSSVESCLRYLENAGFVLEQDGAESPRGGTGSFKTVMRGPIYRVPPSVYR